MKPCWKKLSNSLLIKFVKYINKPKNENIKVRISVKRDNLKLKFEFFFWHKLIKQFIVVIPTEERTMNSKLLYKFKIPL